MSGCPRRIGEASPREWPAQWLFTERVVTHGAHVIEQDVELASAVAGDALSAQSTRSLPVDPESRSLVRRLARRHISGNLAAHRAHHSRSRLGRQALAARALRRRRRGARRARIARAGQRRPGEESLAAAIASGGAVPLTATLPQLIALTRRIALCIGGDTGPLHLASALGRPVVGIYGPTDPSRNGPYGTRARVLRSPDSRRDHSRRAAPDPGLLTISPDDVLRAADELLAEESAR